MGHLDIQNVIIAADTLLLMSQCCQMARPSLSMSIMKYLGRSNNRSRQSIQKFKEYFAVFRPLHTICSQPSNHNISIYLYLYIYPYTCEFPMHNLYGNMIYDIYYDIYYDLKFVNRLCAEA